MDDFFYFSFRKANLDVLKRALTLLHPGLYVPFSKVHFNAVFVLTFLFRSLKTSLTSSKPSVRCVRALWVYLSGFAERARDIRNITQRETQQYTSNSPKPSLDLRIYRGECRQKQKKLSYRENKLSSQNV